MIIVFFVCGFIIFWSMLGYSYSLRLLAFFCRKKDNAKDYSIQPSVTLMIVAHNEEKVIKEKLVNVTNLQYPKEKLNILVASDNSTDKTNEIVEKYIENNKDVTIELFKVKERKGKTNAQNEAQKLVKSEILVMTDANSILKENSINEIVASFTSKDIVYVSGRLTYVKDDCITTELESGYWIRELVDRDIESKFQTITAGNGALYACRNSDYIVVDPIKCHDSAMPLEYALMGKRAIYDRNAIAYEKTGESNSDEYKRKVRMNREILTCIFPDARLFNVFKYRWFTYFYFGHRTCRYLLWISHLLLLIANIELLKYSCFYCITFALQLLFYFMGILGIKVNSRVTNITNYYCLTVLAQWEGVYNIITGKAKPFWEKVESTR